MGKQRQLILTIAAAVVAIAIGVVLSYVIHWFPVQASTQAHNTDRLYHIALETDDADGMRDYLANHSIKVPDHVSRGKIGNLNYFIQDPDGRTVEIQLSVDMLEGRNTTVLDFSRPVISQFASKELAAQADVRLTARIDIEDRNFHSETKRNGGADHHFSTHTHPLPATSPSPRDEGPGSATLRSRDVAQVRAILVRSDLGQSHSQDRSCRNQI